MMIQKKKVEENMFLKRIERLAAIPNAPFLYLAAREAIIREVMLFGNEEVGLTTDEFALYVRLRRGKPKHPLFLVSHLDHPAIVLKDSNGGICLGTVGYERLGRFLQNGPIPLRIFSPEGGSQQKGQVTEFSFEWGIPWVKIGVEGRVATNSHALWDVVDFEIAGGYVRMYAADNIVPTAVALEVLEKVLNNPDSFKDLDLTLIFTYVEEVHQICATGIAKMGKTPFGPIGRESILIALEAMEAISPNELPEGFVAPNYQDGVLIKINDDAVLFGQGFPNAPNLAENLLLRAAQESKIPYQHTLSGGSTDAKSFSLEGVTSSIATLSIPNQHKHNLGPSGEIVAEEVLIRDLQAAVEILTAAVLMTQGVIDGKHPQALAQELKMKGYGLSREEQERLARKRRQIMRAHWPRLKATHFFPENLGEWIDFHLWRGLSRFY